MKTNTNNSNTAIEIADSKKMQDVNKLLDIADHINGIYVDATRVAESYSYPLAAIYELAQATSELTRQFVLLSQYILNPKAEDIDPAIKARIGCGID